MNKKEIIWREILVRARTAQKTIFTQKELAADFRFSLSTVHNALKTPRVTNAITVGGKNFRLESYQKLLYLWASHRKLKKDFIFTAEVDLSPQKLESIMPPRVAFGLYSAAKLIYKIAPADYDHIYVYANPADVKDILGRLPEHKKKSENPNFFVLQKDHQFSKYGNTIPEQIFVDIWNAPEWYAKDYLKIWAEKLHLHD